MTTSNGPHTLDVSGLHVHYGKVCALRDVAFSISSGKAVALMGPNGSGKSTLIKTLVGLIPATAGSVRWRGQPIKGRTTEFAYLPQAEEVDWDFPLTVRGLVEMGRFARLGLWKAFGDKDHRIVQECLRAMDIENLADRNIRRLSGGQQHRAFIARALAQEPHVLLLDEPFAGLDRQAEATLIRLLRSLVERGHLILASHHDVRTAPEIFDEALLLKTRQLDFGPVDQVLSEANLLEAFA